MRLRKALACALMASFVLSGCAIGGFTHEGNDQTDAGGTVSGSGGSSSDGSGEHGGPSDTPAGTGDPSGPVVQQAAPAAPTFTEVPEPVKDEFFPPPIPTDDLSNVKQWEAKVTVRGNGNGMSVVRSVPPCEDRLDPLAIDERVLSTAQTIFEKDGFLISRQLTLYPTPGAAQAFPDELDGAAPYCASPDAKNHVRSNKTQTPAFGVSDENTFYSEGHFGMRGEVYTYFDIVTVRDNAVIWTRLGATRPVKGPSAGPGQVLDVGRNIDANPEWVEMVREQSLVGIATLAALG